MNSYSISLSSNTTSMVKHLSTLKFDDFTQLSIDISNISEKILPMYITIDWGDGKELEIYDNNIYVKGRVNNPLKLSPVLLRSYNYNYYPSSHALYKSLSAQVLINYINGDESWFVIPIQIRTYDYLESLGDLKLLNTNILPISGNPVEYQLMATKNNQIIELIS